MWCRISSEASRLRNALAPPREYVRGAPNRTLTFTRPLNIEPRWTSSVPRIAIGRTGAPECSARIPVAPHTASGDLWRSFPAGTARPRELAPFPAARDGSPALLPAARIHARVKRPTTVAAPVT